MKTIHNKILLSFIALSMTLFSGCKKNDAEVNSSLIESKLAISSTSNTRAWSAPIKLTQDFCGTNATLVLLTDHTFKYIDGSCTYTGSWNADYAANRSGQILNLNFDYTYNAAFYKESFVLKYSSDLDVFYALDQSNSSLKPFTETVYAP